MRALTRCLVADVDTEPITLDDRSVHHLRRVLRLGPGDAFELVDGRGGLALARLLRDGGVEVERRLARRPPPAPERRVAAPAPRTSRLDWLVEKLTELGADALHLVTTTRSVHDVSDARRARLERKVEEAMLQCRRLHAMRVTGPAPLHAVLDEARDAALWVGATPDDGAPPPPAAPPPDRDLLVVVGPEGGWTPEEHEHLMNAGGCPVGLGPNVLRVETAAVALLATAQLLTPRPDG